MILKANMIIFDNLLLIKNLKIRYKQFFLKSYKNMKYVFFILITLRCDKFVNNFNNNKIII